MTSPDEWPKTVRVSGREYEVHPDMSLGEFTEVTQSMVNEIEKLQQVQDVLGLGDMMGGFDDDD